MESKKTRLSSYLSGQISIRVLFVLKSILAHFDGVTILKDSELSLYRFPFQLVCTFFFHIDFERCLIPISKLFRYGNGTVSSESDATMQIFFIKPVFSAHPFHYFKYSIVFICLQYRNTNCEQEIIHVLVR